MQYNPNQAKLNLSRNLIRNIKLKYPNTNDDKNKTNPDSKEKNISTKITMAKIIASVQ